MDSLSQHDWVGGIREGGINIYLETTHLMTVWIPKKKKKIQIKEN